MVEDRKFISTEMTFRKPRTLPESAINDLNNETIQEARLRYAIYSLIWKYFYKRQTPQSKNRVLLMLGGVSKKIV